MPERDKFPKKYFDGNPYEGLEPEEVYKRLRWGNDPSETFEITGPEDMVTLGDVAKVVTDRGTLDFEEGEAYLAVGVETNRVYIVPCEGGEPVDVPDGPYTELAVIHQIDYTSDKGGEEAYYFHEHEEPYPVLCWHEETGVGMIEPEEMEDGSRSYAVGDEGIIG